MNGVRRPSGDEAYPTAADCENVDFLQGFSVSRPANGERCPIVFEESALISSR